MKNTSTVVMDLSFQLLAGLTTQMLFSKTIIYTFDTETPLQVQAEITASKTLQMLEFQMYTYL